MLQQPIVSRDACLEAGRALLEQEQAVTLQQHALSGCRQRVPWVRIGCMVLDTTPNDRNQNGPHRNLMNRVRGHGDHAVVRPARGRCA